MFDNRRLVAVVISLRYDVAARVKDSDEAVVVKLDLLDISISNEPAVYDTPEWNCGADLFKHI